MASEEDVQEAVGPEPTTYHLEPNATIALDRAAAGMEQVSSARLAYKKFDAGVAEQLQTILRLRIEAQRDALERASGEECVRLQGRIAELRDMLQEVTKPRYEEPPQRAAQRRLRGRDY